MVEKSYLAVAEGDFDSNEGHIMAGIARDPERQVWEISDSGKPSETIWRVLETRRDSTLLQLIPVTGRTNQLRLHLAHIGHPILGDDLYGGRPHQRLCLHAAKLTFWHPNGGTRLSFESPVPEGF
jgi:23S rRNA-/tRNA-specific pseudouridylate synthase